MDRLFAAHITEDGKVQTIKEHLSGTASLSEKFGTAFGSAEQAYLCGFLHDIGKYSNKFQKRIYEGGNAVDHSTAGAVEINRILPKIGFLLSYCVGGHHAGLPDGGSIIDMPDEASLNAKLKRTLEDYNAYQDEILPEVPEIKSKLPIRPLEKGGFSVSFYIRMIFSCLVDGDFLDTEKFMDEEKERGKYETIDALTEKMNASISTMQNPKNKINRKRTDILNYCVAKANHEKGLFTLTVPTGGGKTISSLAFALNHAHLHKMDRIIYVIPYNSIIEQNAKVFKEIVGEDNVLEHHSNINYDEIDDSIIEKRRLATENWDTPIIVTTTVQFFESIFANKTSRCRKLHNLANSIIIFDEAQMLPISYLKPCVRSISELVYNYGSSVVLCSATQPNLGRLFPKELEACEICENTIELVRFFKRTSINTVGELDDNELSNRLNQEKQVLCIVNTRKHAQNIFNLLDGDGGYHLSTFMYPQHRKRILDEIRNRLADNLPCKVVSTSLIEAGVDVDFPVVYRAEAGLDSVIQAAGRCNREGRQKESPVYVFKPSEEYRSHMPEMVKRSAAIANTIMHQFEDIASLEAIAAYFSELYRLTGVGLDSKNIVERFEAGMENGFSFPFAEVAAQFHLIDNETRVVIIPNCEKSKILVERLKAGERGKFLLREIQQYAVNVYPRNYDSLYGAGSITPLDEELAVLVDEAKYSEKTGLEVSADNGIAIFV